MGEIARYADNFLKQGGTALGYDWNYLPEVKDMDDVLHFSIHVWEYQGITESEYYENTDEGSMGYTCYGYSMAYNK